MALTLRFTNNSLEPKHLSIAHFELIQNLEIILSFGMFWMNCVKMILQKCLKPSFHGFTCEGFKNELNLKIFIIAKVVALYPIKRLLKNV